MDNLDKNFGLIISLLLPGFLLFAGLSFSYPNLVDLLNSSSDKSPTIGGFFYSTVISLALGLLTSAVRWLFIDWLLWLVKIRRPNLNFAGLKDESTFKAFMAIVDNHYRYYQYYSNTLISLSTSLIIYRFESGSFPSALISTTTVLVSIALLIASGDSLNKYHNSAKDILGVKN